MSIHPALNSDQAGSILKLAGVQAEPARVTLLKQHNHVYLVQAGGATYYIKFYTKSWYGDDPERLAFNVEHECCAYSVLKKAGLPVPDLVYGQHSADNAAGMPFLLLSALPGDNLLHVLAEPEATPYVLEQVGDILRRMHAITFDHAGYLACHDAAEPLDETGWLHRCWTPSARQKDAGDMLNRERDHMSTRVVDHLEAAFSTMGQRLAPAYQPPRFVHGDCHAHQFFLHGAGPLWRVTGVVDMEVASAGDPGEDLLKFCMEMMHAMPTWTHWWEPFFAGYGGAPDFELLRLRLLGASEHEFRVSGWPGARDTLVSRLLVAQDWEDLFGF